MEKVHLSISSMQTLNCRKPVFFQTLHVSRQKQLLHQYVVLNKREYLCNRVTSNQFNQCQWPLFLSAFRSLHLLNLLLVCEYCTCKIHISHGFRLFKGLFGRLIFQAYINFIFWGKYGISKWV